MAENRGWSGLARTLQSFWHTAAERSEIQVQGVKTMTNMSNIGQSVVATVAAILLTATAVTAAVGPAEAVDAAPVSLVAASVSGQAAA